jgi:hypothetical protein
MNHVLARGRLVAIAGFVVIAAAFVGCGGGGGSAPQPGTPASQNSQAPASQATAAGFTATQSQTLGASGSPVPLPTGSGYGGTVTLPTPQSTMPANTVVTETLTNSAANARQFPQYIAPPPIGNFLVFLSLQFSNAMTIPLPSFQINVPSSVIFPNAVYFLAMYDPQASQGFPSGWQTVEGPVTANGNTLDFSGASFSPYGQPYPFTAYSPVFFGVFQTGGTVPSPTPSPVSSGTPEPAFVVSPSQIQVNGIGADGYATIEDPAMYSCSCSYSVSVTNSQIASAWTDGVSLTVQGNAAGLTSLVITSSDGRSAIANVTVTQTNVNVQGAARR